MNKHYKLNKNEWLLQYKFDHLNYIILNNEYKYLGNRYN